MAYIVLYKHSETAQRESQEAADERNAQPSHAHTLVDIAAL